MRRTISRITTSTWPLSGPVSGFTRLKTIRHVTVCPDPYFSNVGPFVGFLPGDLLPLPPLPPMYLPYTQAQSSLGVMHHVGEDFTIKGHLRQLPPFSQKVSPNIASSSFAPPPILLLPIFATLFPSHTGNTYKLHQTVILTNYTRQLPTQPTQYFIYQSILPPERSVILCVKLVVYLRPNQPARSGVQSDNIVRSCRQPHRSNACFTVEQGDSILLML